MDYARNNKRHRRLFAFLKRTVGPIITRFIGYHYEKTTLGSTPTVIISNHTTNFDPILVACSFREHMYFVASEHIFRWGFKSRLIEHFFAPIVRTKGQADVSTALTTMRLLKKGYNVCIFAEGIKTHSGITEPITQATGKLVKASGAQLVTFRLEGGYFTTPAWGNGMRRGRMTGHFVNRYSSEELKEMTADEVNAVISRDIREDAYASQIQSPVRYHGKTPAEHLEKVLYLCPKCLRLATIVSEGSRFFCQCGLSGSFNDFGKLCGEDFSFQTVTDWFFWQREKLSEIVADSGFCHSTPGQQLIRVTDEEGAIPAAEGQLSMSRDTLEIGETIFPLSQIGEFSVHDGDILIFFHKGVHYEVQSPFPRSALLYQDLFQLFKEPKPGEHGQV